MPVLTVVFPIAIVFVCSVISMRNKILNIISRYYLSIYAMQGIPILIYTHIYSKESPIYCMLFVTSITLVLSVFINPIFDNITKKIKN